MPNQSSDNNKRIAKNTLILYVRMLFTVGISFCSTRLILANLGVENYGIYNVIGGFVSMVYMVTATMTQAVNRFLTFDLGRGRYSETAEDVFHVSQYPVADVSCCGDACRNRRIVVCEQQDECRRRQNGDSQLDLPVLCLFICLGND